MSICSPSSILGKRLSISNPSSCVYEAFYGTPGQEWASNFAIGGGSVSHAADGDGAAASTGSGASAGEPTVSTPAESTGRESASSGGPIAGAPDATTVTVWRSANRHGAATVFVEAEHACRQLVAYANEEVEAAFARLPAGTTLPVRMEPVAGRGDGWRVTAIP